MPEIVLLAIPHEAFRSEEEDDPGPCSGDDDVASAGLGNWGAKLPEPGGGRT